MGSDLFGSLAESTVAALLISATSKELILNGSVGFLFPIAVICSGIIVCMIVCYLTDSLYKLKSTNDVGFKLKLILILSTILMIPAIYGLGLLALPRDITFRGDSYKTVVSSSYTPNETSRLSSSFGFSQPTLSNEPIKPVTITTTTKKEEFIVPLVVITTNFKLIVCSLSGLISELVFGYITDYFTYNSHGPIVCLCDSCKFGAGINIINGLALGYMSTFIPILFICASIYVSFTLAGMYGIALCAIGILVILPVCLAIDAYGPIADNAGGISKMSDFNENVRIITESLDSAGNTTAAVGKGFAIGSACLVAIALFGAFITKTKLGDIDMLNPMIISTMVLGAIIPFVFPSLAIYSVCEAAA